MDAVGAGQARRRRVAAVVLGIGAVALIAGWSATAHAGRLLRPPAGWPDLAGAAVATADFPTGAKVDTQGYVKPGSGDLAEYDRSFADLSVVLRGKKLLGFEDDVTLGRSASQADSTIKLLPLGLLLVSNQIGKQFAKSAHIKVTYTKVGKPKSLAVGDDSVGALIRFGTKAGELRFVIGAVRVGQLDSLFFFVGVPRAQLGVPDAATIARLAVKHVHAAMGPQNTAVPTIQGNAQVGQSLGALPGSWLSFPKGYAYQWQHCDASGANCTSIAGATSQIYVVAATDANATLRVVVTAQNAYGTGTATSAQTALVPAPPVPGPSGP